jgi:hypothetical protein
MAAAGDAAGAIARTQQILSELGIKNVPLAKHEAVMTADAHAKLANLPKGALAKNLFLKDKKRGLILVTMRADRQLDIKELTKRIQASSLRFADAAQMQEVLGVGQGSVTPLAACNDKGKAVSCGACNPLERVIASRATHLRGVAAGRVRVGSRALHRGGRCRAPAHQRGERGPRARRPHQGAEGVRARARARV